MKKFLVLFIAISFLAGAVLVGCGQKTEQAPTPTKEEAKPAPPTTPPAPPEAAPPAPTTPPAQQPEAPPPGK